MPSFLFNSQRAAKLPNPVVQRKQRVVLKMLRHGTLLAASLCAAGVSPSSGFMSVLSQFSLLIQYIFLGTPHLRFFMRFNRLTLVFSFCLICCVLLDLTSSAQASYTLYGAGQTKPISNEARSFFGPKSREFRYDSRMIEAAELAAKRAESSSQLSCWRYVKTALLKAHLIDSYPKTRYAKEAGDELQMSFGFRKINVSDPYKAPPGSVLVYGGAGAGHVELRLKEGFVSDFISVKPSQRPLIGVYVKPRQ